MKKLALILLSVILASLLLFASCADNTTENPAADNTTIAATDETTAEGLWADAVYTEDTTLGEGNTAVSVAVKADDRTVTFTIMTDKTILGDALTDTGLVEGENGAYGLYIKKVNGITADYSVNQSYWAFYINGEYAITGVDSTEISADANYELVYTAEA